MQRWLCRDILRWIFSLLAIFRHHICNTSHQWFVEIVGLMVVRLHGHGDNSLELRVLDLMVERCVDFATATLAAQEHGSSGDGVNEESCDVVASHPLFAGLFKEISAKCPELAALVPEISKVGRAAVPTPKSTATPAEQREESLQALRKATKKKCIGGGGRAQTRQEA